MPFDENTQKYGGTWKISDVHESYGGDLYINEEKNFITLVLTIPATSENRLPLWPGTSIIPWISGTLVNGKNVLLYGCHLGTSQSFFGSHRSQIIIADYAFWGLENNEEISFIGARIDFGDILGWYDLCKFDDLFLIDSNSEFGYQWDKKEIFVFPFRKGLTISFIPVFASNGNQYDKKITLSQKVIVEFKYTRKREWKKILDDIKKIQYLISIGAGQKIEIDSVKYLHNSHVYYSPYRKDPEFIASTVYLGTGKNDSPQRIRPDNYLFKLEDFCKIPNGIENWSRYYQKIEPVLDLVFSLPSTNSSPVISFLMLTQALETYHARFIASELKDYKKIVENVLSGLSDNEKAYWRDFLIDPDKKNDVKHNIIQLKNRIAFLLYEGGDSLFQRNRIGLPSANFPQKVADSRNYYTHYVEKMKQKSYTPDQLVIVNHYLQYLIFYHLMKFIGFPADFIAEKISNYLQKIKNKAIILNINIWS